MSKQTKLIVLFFIILKLALHLVTDRHSGFQGDELLHIETGKHLAFGYMEFPPLIAVLAFIQNLLSSNSVFVHHLFSHIASLLILIVVAKTTLELGGGNKAVFLVLLAIIVAPSFGRSQQLFQPVVFSQLFWTLGFYQLVRFIKYLDKKSLWLLTLFCVLGFLTKYDSVFFLFGLTGLLLFSRTRTALIKQKIWLNIILFTICILPNIVWQIANDFPVIQMFDRLYEMHLDTVSRSKNLIKLLLAVNPIVSLLLIIPSIIYLIKTKNKEIIRTLSIVIALSFLLLFYKNGKQYYFYPIILTLLPFGAIFWDQVVFNKRKWVFYPISILLTLGAILIPFGMPVYGFSHYIDTIYPFEKKEIKGGKYGIEYDEYYTQEKWKTTLKELESTYNSLSEKETENSMIWAKNYAQAGAVNILGKPYNLPKAFSYHGSFYNWAPTGEMPNTIIALSYQVGDFFLPYFEEVELVKSIYNPYANTEEELYQRIYICKTPKQNFSELKKLFKTRIFE